jgi:DNA polymerase I-like protein with 3'-5' exonuclease and polymerase domains
MATDPYKDVRPEGEPIGTITGRYSSAKPNLQNIPIRTVEGRRIRDVLDDVADIAAGVVGRDRSGRQVRIHSVDDIEGSNQ